MEELLKKKTDLVIEKKKLVKEIFAIAKQIRAMRNTEVLDKIKEKYKTNSDADILRLAGIEVTGTNRASMCQYKVGQRNLPQEILDLV